MGEEKCCPHLDLPHLRRESFGSDEEEHQWGWAEACDLEERRWGRGSMEVHRLPP